jgi:hypothetical protein
MKMTTKFGLAGVLLAVMVLAGCEGGEDVESNIGAVMDIASVEEDIEEVEIAQGSTAVETEKPEQQEVEGVKEVALTEKNAPETAESEEAEAGEEMKETEEKAVTKGTFTDEKKQASADTETNEAAAAKEAAVEKALPEVKNENEMTEEETAAKAKPLEEEGKSDEKSAEEEEIAAREEAGKENKKVQVGEENPGKEKEAVEEMNIAGNLQKFYGRWETREENPADKIILEMGLVDARDLHNSDEGFEYIRFGYEASEFFPREKITKTVENSSNSYVIRVDIMEEKYENGDWSVIETGNTEEYQIELSDQNNMVLTYSDDGGKTEYVFYKQ